MNDINKPLINLWQDIIYSPQSISDKYANLWNLQNERTYFKIRDEFNEKNRTDHLLYLLARCVKASIRYNAAGKFNQSPDNRRKGKNPIEMKQDILKVSKLFAGRSILTGKDYKEVLVTASSSDLIYMDPPYQGTCGNRDSRYCAGIDFQEFIAALQDLKERDISFILSYDGRTGKKIYGQHLPTELGLHRIEVDAGRSTQATLLGKEDRTYESLYLSEALMLRLDDPTNKFLKSQKCQLTLAAF